MKSSSARWLLALIVPIVMVISAGLIGVYVSGDSASSGGSIACEDKVPAEQRNATYRDSGVNPAHEQDLDALPVYPGCVQVHDPVTNGAGSFAFFWATATPAEAASFYSEELPALGWQAVSEPATVSDPGGRPVVVLMFSKDKYSLTVYFDDNPSKGDGLGNLYVTFRLQELYESGGGGQPPSRLLEVYNSLPSPSGLTMYPSPVSTGIELQAHFYAADLPERLLEFYNRELSAMGWHPEDLSVTVVSDPKLDGTRSSSTHSTFLKDDLRVTVNVVPNLEAPDLGATRLGIDIRPTTEP